jgi:malate synthase
MESRQQIPIGVTILGPQTAEVKQILTPEALQFLAALHRKFNFKRQKLLQARCDRALRFLISFTKLIFCFTFEIFFLETNCIVETVFHINI